MFSGCLVPGDPQEGLWCGACLLPSRVRWPIYMLTGTGIGLFGHLSMCVDHDSEPAWERR